ncbi:MAG: 3-hydroxyacyl-CoA dehydrogenase, partial [Roseovarius sp.]|nr:3-hydroxyacyl-CoA dehydrogenase [Roseovarius sp.]
TTLFSLGAHGGLQAFFDHFTDTFNGWWDDLGRPYLSREVIEEIVAGLHEATEGQSEEPLVEKRDAMILAIRAALRKFEDGK